MFNDAGAIEMARSVSVELLGEENVFDSPPIMAGEDLALITERVPGCMLELGVANPERGIIYPPHLPRFDADEDAMAVCVRALSGIALRFLDADIRDMVHAFESSSAGNANLWTDHAASHTIRHEPFIDRRRVDAATFATLRSSG